MQAFLRAQDHLESHFAAYHCRCRLEVNDTMTIHITRPGSEGMALLMAGILRKEWQTTEALDLLVIELRQELEDS